MSQQNAQFAPAPKFDKHGNPVSAKPAFIAAADAIVGPTVLTVEQVRNGMQQPQQLAEQSHVMEAQVVEQQEYEQPEQEEQQVEAVEHEEVEEVAHEPLKKLKAAMPSKEVNLRRLREDRDRVQQERDLLARELELMRRVQPQQQYQQQPPPPAHQEDTDIDTDFGDDDLIEGKHLKKIVSSLNNKFKQNSYRSAQEVARAQEAAIDLQIQAKYPDFNSVVNNATLRDLEAAYPEIAASLHSTPSLYNKAVSAYTMIKNLGINDEVAEEEVNMAEKQKVRRNAVKPRPSNANVPTHQSPLSQAGSFAELTPTLMEQMRKEMAAARKRL